MTHKATIACTLDARSHAERVTWIAQLNRSSLQRHARIGRMLLLEYSPSAANDLALLVERERECCAFLTFKVENTDPSITLRIEAPSRVTDEQALDALFSPFLTRLDANALASEAAYPFPATPAASDPVGRSLAISGIAGVAVIACAACCTVPLFMPALSLSLIGSAVSLGAGGARWALLVGAVALGAALIWAVMRSRREAGKSRTVRVLLLLVGATWIAQMLAR